MKGDGIKRQIPKAGNLGKHISTEMKNQQNDWMNKPLPGVKNCSIQEALNSFPPLGLKR